MWGKSEEEWCKEKGILGILWVGIDLKAWKEVKKEKNICVEGKLVNFSFMCGWKRQKKWKKWGSWKKMRGEKEGWRKRKKREWILKKIVLLVSLLKSCTIPSYLNKKKNPYDYKKSDSVRRKLWMLNCVQEWKGEVFRGEWKGEWKTAWRF